MSSLENDIPAAEKAPDLRSGTRNDETSSGLEINLGDFTRTQGLMKSLRLMLNNQVVVQVEDISSGVGEAGRKFKIGDLEQSNQDVARLYSAFGQRTSQWENQARNLEQQMKMKAAKDPKSVSINAMNTMKSEQVAVRTRIRTAEIQFRRLHQGLDQAFTNLQSQPRLSETQLSETELSASELPPSLLPAGLPPGFFARFQAAPIEDRPNLIKAHFEIEAVLQVTVTRGTTSPYDIKFAPLPPPDRLYFFTKTSQLVSLKQLGNTVVIQDQQTGQTNEIKLVEFVKHIQSGDWLLKPLGQ